MREHLDEESVDVVVTSPPYNIGTNYNAYVDRLPREEYLGWMHKVGNGVRRVLARDGSFFLNVGSPPSDPWMAWDIANEMREIFSLQNVIHWVKSIAISKKDVGNYPPLVGDAAVGHYKPVLGNRFLNNSHEYIFHFTKSGRVRLDRLAIGVPYQDGSNAGRWKSGAVGVRCRGNTWFIPYRTIHDRMKQRPHPSPFPEALPEMCIKLHGIERIELVLDPFMGIGTTAVACTRLGLPCVGFEIDEAYASIATLSVKSASQTAKQKG